MAMGRLLTVAQVTRLSGLNRKTIERRIASGVIGSVVDAATGRAMVDVSELLRVFPNIPANAIESELGGKITGNVGSAPSMASSVRGGLDGDASASAERIAAMEREIALLREMNNLLKGEVEALRADKTDLFALLHKATSALPAPSKKSSAASVQPRDSKGHFQSPKPKQAQASLIPDERR